MTAAPEKPRARFGTPEIDRIAEKLSEMLTWDLEKVASNRGDVTLFPYDRRNVADLTDAEVSAYLQGIYSQATHLGAWLEESLAFGGAHDEDHSKESRAVIVRHSATQDQIEAAVAGAEGECFQRRHPGKGGFAGRFRKANETIVLIRSFRVQIEDLPVESEEASDFAFTWYEGAPSNFSRVHDLLRKKTGWREASVTDEDERRAWKRVKLECAALEACIARARNRASDRREREYQARFGKGVV